MSVDLKEILRSCYPQLSEPSLIDDIVQYGKLYTYPPDTVILEVGAQVRMVPLLLKGSIKVIREEELEGRELFLYYIKSGETCSMSFSCCLSNKRSDIRTITDEESTFIGIPVQYVDQWITQYPSWKRFVMKSYDDRMQELVRTIDRIAFQQLDERLINYLQQKSEATGSNKLNITHQEIAYDLNASREAISRLLKKMEGDQLVRLSRNQIEMR